MISVICLNRADPKERKEASTLIIAPVALLDQWKKEIENKSKGSLSVYTYHGPNKSSSKNVSSAPTQVNSRKLTY